MRDRMEELGISIQQLASRTEVVYETIRKAIAGDQPPSRKLLRDICAELDLDFEEVHAIQVEEKLQKKYPDALAKLAGKDPELQPLDQQWKLLTPEQREHILLLARSYASENLIRKKSSKSLQIRPELAKARTAKER